MALRIPFYTIVPLSILNFKVCSIPSCVYTNFIIRLFSFKNSALLTSILLFLNRIKNEIIPIEVKRNRGRSKSLNVILNNNENINYGIKLTGGNIGFEDNKFTFPYYLTFLLKRFFKDTDYIKWD